MSSARQPLIRPALFKDVNFASSVLLMFMIGIFMVSSLALMTPWLQVLIPYPVETAGLIMAPRGFGSLATTMLTGRLLDRIDARVLVRIGLLMLSYTYCLMTGWTPDVSQRELIIAVVIQCAAMRVLRCSACYATWAPRSGSRSRCDGPALAKPIEVALLAYRPADAQSGLSASRAHASQDPVRSETRSARRGGSPCR